MRRAVLYVIAVAACVCAQGAISIPATRSGYRFVDVSGIEITGEVLSVRRASGTELVLRAEDMALLAEGASERDRWINYTNACAALYSPAPSLVLSSNLLAQADRFFSERGRRIKPWSEITAADEVACFVDANWTDSGPSLQFVDMNISGNVYIFNDERYVGGLYGYLSPSNTVVRRIQNQYILSTNDIESIYANIGKTRRVLAGIVGNTYSDPAFESPSWCGCYDVQAGSIRYTYDTPGDDEWEFATLVNHTTSGWSFERVCWSSDGGRVSPYGWTQTAYPPKVVLRPCFNDIVESATLYLTLYIIRVTGYTGTGSDAAPQYSCPMGYIRMSLTRANKTTVGGVACETWQMPADMKNSKDILGPVIEHYTGLENKNYPCVVGVYAGVGVVDLVLSPHVDLLDDGND